MKELSNSEKMVISCIYKHTRATGEKPNLHDLERILLNDFGISWKLQTLCTFLTRIEGKGYITAERVKRYSYYTPVLPHDDYIKAELQNIANIYFGGKTSAIKKYI